MVLFGIQSFLSLALPGFILDLIVATDCMTNIKPEFYGSIFVNCMNNKALAKQSMINAQPNFLIAPLQLIYK